MHMLVWWSKRISMAITKTGSRSVAFKVARMRESILSVVEGSRWARAYLEDDKQAAAYDDVGYNKDLYIANQEVVHD